MERREDPLLIDLAAKAEHGDARALDALCRRLWDPLRRYLAKRLQGDPAARERAEDLTQDVLLRVVSHLDGLAATTDAEFRAWVLAIARRRFIDYLRQDKRDPMRTASPLGRPPAADRVRRPGPVDLALFRALTRAQGKLPDETTEIFWRRLVSGAPWAEIGQALEISEGAAKRRFQRGQQRLRRLLLDELDDLDEELRADILERLRHPRR